MSRDEQGVEQAIQAKGLNAPRLKPADISNAIADVYFHLVPNTTCMICALILRNGFVVVGKSASASAENFDAEIGKSVAMEDARSQIWALEGYLLRERLRAKAAG